MSDQIKPSELLSLRLRQAIYWRGASQAELSRCSHIHPSAISRFISGHRQLSLTAASRLAHCLDRDLLSLNGWKEREQVWKAYQNGDLVKKPGIALPK